MGYWESKVLPKFKKIFQRKNANQASAAAEACKSFDESKKAIHKEFEEKRVELQPKVLDLYRASSNEITIFVKERNEAKVKNNSNEVQKFHEELVKIGRLATVLPLAQLRYWGF